MLLKESVDTENEYLDMVSLLKETQGTKGAYSSETQNTHPTGEFILGS